MPFDPHIAIDAALASCQRRYRRQRIIQALIGWAFGVAGILGFVYLIAINT